MMCRTFEFNEGTVIASVSQETLYDADAGKITAAGRFKACLIGGTAPGIKPTMVKDAKKKSDQDFASEDAAFRAAFDLAIELGYHPIAGKGQDRTY